MTSVIYGMGIEADGGNAPPRFGSWEKLRLRVVAMPLSRRHAALWLFMMMAGNSGSGVVGGKVADASIS